MIDDKESVYKLANEIFKKTNGPVPLKTVRRLARGIVELCKENKKLLFMIENGLGFEDMKNDITYPPVE